MPFHRSRMALRPINRIKHVVDISATLTAGTTIKNVLVASTDTPTLGNSSGVETGSKVNGLYLKVEVASNQVTEAGAIPNVYMMIVKNPGNNITMPAPNAVGVSDNKRFSIHQEMIMIENQVSGNPRILFNGVITIPKGMRRFGPSDKLVCTILSPVIDISFCIQCHYKEFR